MNISKKLELPKLTLCILLATALTACGGGGGSNDPATSSPSTGSQPVAKPQITGKAIDGYLVGALVCADLNGNGICDAGEPQATTDANGNYGLVSSDDLTGKKLLVVVTPTTKDLQRPGYTFPASFALSQYVDGTTEQNVTPLTSLVAAQMDTGMTKAAATASVISLVGGNVNLNDDYIANGNSAAATFAASVVDKVSSFATNGTTSTDLARAVMIAIVNKGSVSAVAQSDVDAAIQKPVYSAAVSGSSVLADPSFAYVGPIYAGNTPSVVRENWSQQGANIQRSYEVQDSASGTWSANPTAVQTLTGQYGVYAMKADASWSGFIAQSDFGSQYQVQSTAANTTKTIDPSTGIGATFDFRQGQLDGKSLVYALPWSATPDLIAALHGTFSSGSTGYAMNITHDQDQVVIPVSMNCANGTPIIEDGHDQCPLLGNPTQQYTSVNQALTAPPVPFIGIGYIRFGQNGQMQVYDGNDASKVLLDSNKISWSTYGRNADVLVFKVAYADIAGIPNVDTAMLNMVKQGGSIVIARINGHLRFGYLLPASVPETTMVVKTSVFDQIIGAVKAALLTI
ncbi:MAG: hypothetical protein M3O74_09115 [Pseudomonadota bacterium]|nr:hypothetical protein [Pseudomonadota bacterium]